MVEFYMFSYGYIVNDSIEWLKLFIFLAIVLVFVKFPQEGNGSVSDSLEENFTLKEYVDFLAFK